MTGFTEDTSAETVLARLSECPDGRLSEVMSSVIRHLHAMVKEVEPTQEEWMTAIRFLTEVGQMCDERRQEWILLSDILGVSMLIDAINNRKPAMATPSTVLGPFHVEGAPELPLGANISKTGKGEPLLVSGRVLDEAGRAIAGAELDIWQTSPDGFYDVQQPDEQPAMNLRGRFRTDKDGVFHFRSIKPCSYPIPTDGPVGKLLTGMGRHPYRPAHIHFIISADGYEPVTTHLFVEGDEYLDSDAVFGVKDALIVPFVLHPAVDGAEAYYTVENEFRLCAAS